MAKCQTAAEADARTMTPRERIIDILLTREPWKALFRAPAIRVPWFRIVPA
jgi:hypothetical protein